MVKIKPSIPRGMRDFTPVEMRKRKYILNTIEAVFQKYGFQQIETPAMEKREVLMGKYGEEGDKLIFNVLNSGDYLSDVEKKKLEKGNSRALTPEITKKALRYDLTVPLARYVAQHRHEIAFPFKRYQIQPVWRADKPQKGRYREFYQCDADVIGSDSLLVDFELMQLFFEAFQKLNLDGVKIVFNNRKILSGIAEAIDAQDQLMEMTIAIDKLDKVGIKGVKKELSKRGFSDDQIDQIETFLNISGEGQGKLNALADQFASSGARQGGVADLQKLFNYLDGSALPLDRFEFDIALARGLDYYTGTIFEVKVDEVDIGSIAAGGRYDDLCSTFGLSDVSGIGISFGVDRIYDVMAELELFPERSETATQVLITNFDASAEAPCLDYLQQLREAGINAEFFPDAKKLKKQFKYADKKGIPYVILAGPTELENGQLGLKNMISGEQDDLSFEEILQQLKKN